MEARVWLVGECNGDVREALSSFRTVVVRMFEHSRSEQQRFVSALSTPFGQAFMSLVFGAHEHDRDERIRAGAEANGVHFIEGIRDTLDPTVMDGYVEARIRVSGMEYAHRLDVSWHIFKTIEEDPVARSGLMGPEERVARAVLSGFSQGLHWRSLRTS
jgi:hypothetical protein